MTNAEKIQTMSVEELNSFLWWWKINSIASFFEKGGTRLMNAMQQKEWLLEEEGKTIPEEIKNPEDELRVVYINLPEE